MPPEVAWPEGGITMDYPSYPPVIPNAFFSYPWYGHAGNSMCYGSGLQQATQQANIQQLNSRILELQMQQCCCNQITALNNRLSDMVNAAQFQQGKALEEQIAVQKAIDQTLTLEQLRQMDGEPVYIPETNCWVLVTQNPFVPLFTWLDREQCSAYDWYEQVGPVYRCPPEKGGTHG